MIAQLPPSGTYYKQTYSLPGSGVALTVDTICMFADSTLITADQTVTL